MKEYKTIKDCAVDIICEKGDKLSNKQIAEQVRDIMKSNTTWKSIAWYKNKINRGIIKVDRQQYKWIRKGKVVLREITVENLDEINYENEAERIVAEYEKKRTGKYPKSFKKGPNSPGYDLESTDRHIEVKGKKNKGTRWLPLTANETEKLIKDPKYWLYLVEGDIEKKPDNVDIYAISKNDLLSMTQLKIHARLTQLSNKEKRKNWKVRKV
ncbi:MAG: DUF3883 domain-containing protein [bacterium]